MQDQQLYRDRIDAELSRMRHDLDSLKAAVQENGDEEPTRFTRYVDAIEQKQEKISNRLDTLPVEGNKAKREIEKGVKEAWDRIAIATKAAKARIH